MSESPDRSPDPGRARLAYRRLKSAAGVGDLPALEARVEELADEIAESRALETPLAEVLGGVEQSLVPLLEARLARSRSDVP